MKKFIRNLLFKIFYYKIPKKNFGRCISCDANSFCGTKIKCTASMEQQYKKRDIDNIINHNNLN